MLLLVFATTRTYFREHLGIIYEYVSLRFGSISILLPLNDYISILFSRKACYYLRLYLITIYNYFSITIRYHLLTYLVTIFKNISLLFTNRYLRLRNIYDHTS